MLKATLPHDGLGLPLDIGGVRLAGLTTGRLTSVQTGQGGRSPLTEVLRRKWGLELPAPGMISGAGGVELRWMGQDLWFLVGADPAPLAGAAQLTDQSDAWGAVTLSGPAATDVLARLCPLDLHPSVFAAEQAARTDLRHIAVSISRTADGFHLLVPRSFMRTAVEDLIAAMTSVAAQSGLSKLMVPTPRLERGTS